MKQFNDKCPFCGGQLSHDGEEAVGSWREGYEGDDEALIHYMRCRKCGRDFEVFDPTKEERETDYKEYWK